jgi:hypothetical protein
VELQPGGLPVKSTEKVPEAAVAELNVPEIAVLPVIEKEFPTIAWGTGNVRVSPLGEGEQFPDKLYPMSTRVIALLATVNPNALLCEVFPLQEPS